MKHILIKTTDGGIMQMGLHAYRFTRLADSKTFSLAAAMVNVDGTLRIPLVVKDGESGVLSMPILGYDKGLTPAGWEFGYATVEECIAKWQPEQRALVASWREVPWEGIPWDHNGPDPRQTDKTFRGAWCDVTPEPKVDIDMPKAREIWRNRMRQARAPLMEALDVEQRRALVAKDDARVADTETKLQALRDVTATQAIEAAKTPEALTAVWPAVLGPARAE